MLIGKRTTMILLIDNYDSFVHNLARYLRRLGQRTIVVRNDVLAISEIRRLRPQAIVISPGPGAPRDAGCSVEVVRQLGAEIPILGVCLGHQAIAAAFGAQIVRAPQPMHGRISSITHQRTELFRGIPSPFDVCRYHSLATDKETLPNDLRVTAEAPDGTVMALEHVDLPSYGVQFHPEAVLTRYGYQLLSNFLCLAGFEHLPDVAELTDTEYRIPTRSPAQLPQVPVTF